MKTKQIVLLISAVVIIYFVYTFFIKNSGDKNGIAPDVNVDYPKPTPAKTNSTTETLTDVGGNGVLKVGSKNRQVYWLQSYYNENYAFPRGIAKIALDGSFGNQTKNAVTSTIGTNSLIVSTTWNDFKKWVDNKNANDNSSNTNYWLNVAEKN
jgi:hypothetical protein